MLTETLFLCKFYDQPHCSGLADYQASICISKALRDPTSARVVRGEEASPPYGHGLAFSRGGAKHRLACFYVISFG